VDVMAGGFNKPPTDSPESATRAVTFTIARQTEMAMQRWGRRLRLAMVRARLTIPAGVDNFTHTGALIDLGRAAGDRLLAEHLDSRFRVRPGLLELTLPETVSKPPVVAPRSPAEMLTDQTDLRTELAG
jgi:hypothetical protein